MIPATTLPTLDNPPQSLHLHPRLSWPAMIQDPHQTNFIAISSSRDVEFHHTFDLLLLSSDSVLRIFGATLYQMCLPIFFLVCARFMQTLTVLSMAFLFPFLLVMLFVCLFIWTYTPLLLEHCIIIVVLLLGVSWLLCQQTEICICWMRLGFAIWAWSQGRSLLRI